MTDTKKYQSRYGAKGYITAANFLVEEICTRIAKKEGRVLPTKFWNHPEWSKIYKAQLKHANLLLDEVSCLQIMSFLRTFRGKQVYSLGLKKIIVEGAKKFVGNTNEVESPDGEIITDDILANIEVDISDREQTKSGGSLWGKLQ